MFTPFKTQDLNQAAFVWSQEGVELIELKPKLDGPKEVFNFCFNMPMDEKGVFQLMLDYQNGKTLVEPSDFVRKQNYLRNQIRNARRN